MYYYDTKDCVLNRETRKTVLSQFFLKVSNDRMNVDYFENNCVDRKLFFIISIYLKLSLVECNGGTELHWVYMNKYRIDSRHDIILSGVSAEKCKKYCEVSY